MEDQKVVAEQDGNLLLQALGEEDNESDREADQNERHVIARLQDAIEHMSSKTLTVAFCLRSAGSGAGDYRFRLLTRKRNCSCILGEL